MRESTQTRDPTYVKSVTMGSHIPVIERTIARFIVIYSLTPDILPEVGTGPSVLLHFVVIIRLEIIIHLAVDVIFLMSQHIFLCHDTASTIG